MAERPILFSGPMVRAILNGAKTQTRRVVEPQPRELLEGFSWQYDHIGQCWHAIRDNARAAWPGLKSPYGLPGSLLWVRETWAVVRGEPCLAHERDWQSLRHPVIRYSADGETRRCDRPYHGPVEKGRPSIHMAREYSRLTLRVTSVRVEQLQEISEADAEAEGVTYHNGLGVGHSGWRIDSSPVYDTPQDAFQALWDSINADRAPWSSNPWVWVVGFERA